MSSPQITKKLFKLKKIMDRQKDSGPVDTAGSDVDSILNSINLNGEQALGSTGVLNEQGNERIS